MEAPDAQVVGGFRLPGRKSVRDPSEKVVVAYLHPGEYSAGFGESLLDLREYDHVTTRRLDAPGGRLAFRAGSNLATPRNRLVEQFLLHGKAEWLWIVDSDMTFAPDTLERLLEYADPDKAPIVGGLCFGFDEQGEVQPTLFGLLEHPDHPGDLDHLQVIRYQEWTPDAMYQVAGTGAACLLVHKSALERIRDFERPSGQRGFDDAYPWFQETKHDGKPVGEDVTFCWRAIQAGMPIYVNTAVQCGHVKERVLTMESYFLARGLLSPTHQGASS
jgi:hypothetical protein